MKAALTDRASRCLSFLSIWIRVSGCLKGGWISVLALCAGCAMTTGLASAESRPDPAKIGVLWTSDPSRVAQYLQPFKESMRELGWIDGRTVHYVERYAYGDLTRLPALAAELVVLDVDVLFVSDYAVPAARQATKKIPIVCPNFYDPVLEGITKSMTRPGGNVTGVSWQSVESAAKRLQLTQELIPGLRRVGLLFDATDPGAVMEARGLLVSARRAGIDLTQQSPI